MSTRSGWMVALVMVAAAAAGGGWYAGRAGVAGGAASGTGAAAPASAAGGGGADAPRKLLYYRNPMGLPDTSPVPKKDPMGMDYIAVYEGEDTGGAVKVSADRLQTMGVRTEPVERRVLDAPLRAVGVIEIDERGQRVVAPRFEGWIEKLYVNTTGQAVARGAPLAEVYSPELVSAQREWLIAVRAERALAGAGAEAQQGARDLAAAALERLRNWDVSPQQLERLHTEGEPRRTLTLVAPAAGVIVKDPPVAGMRFMPGEALFRIADLARVWLIADVPEQDLARVRAGQAAKLRIDAYPDRAFDGTVEFVYPVLNEQGRTARVRVVLANPQGLLKPGMYGTAQLMTGAAQPVLAVPAAAVLERGTRHVVLLALGEGRFEPRDVTLGVRSGDWVEIKGGLKEGESVVTRANFLIDSEANLKAALAGFTAGRDAQDAPRGGAGPIAADGFIIEIDAARDTVLLNHNPIPALQWPSMEMEFKVAPGALPKALKPGDRVQFEMVAGKPGEYTITKMVVGAPAAAAGAAAPQAAPAAAPLAPPAAAPHRH